MLQSRIKQTRQELSSLSTKVRELEEQLNLLRQEKDSVQRNLLKLQRCSLVLEGRYHPSPTTFLSEHCDVLSPEEFLIVLQTLCPH